MNMALLEAGNMLPASGGSEVPVHVHKLTDSTYNAHCLNCGAATIKVKLCPAQGKRSFAKFCLSVPDTPIHILKQNDCTPDNSEINEVGIMQISNSATVLLLMSQFHCFWTLGQRFLL
ncbi:hypothetical protein XELAEV_18031766mg [Xenopus laevis]|uniref:Uncharacterized protein n=1 Tax=Xenopus laevis TaxID=8355 RepID=A0A974HG25_XENLA|nr:hypothetical protein XELAEV_18031766mg [Xenopus laevis]